MTCDVSPVAMFCEAGQNDLQKFPSLTKILPSCDTVLKAWVERVLPEAKFKIKCILFFEFLDLSDRFRDICKNGVWGPG